MHIFKVNPENKQGVRNVIVLACAQCFLGAQLPMLFILGGLAGNYLSMNKCVSTLPISMIIIGSMVAAPILAQFMQKFGRQIGFIVGTLAGAAGASLCTFALFKESFALFLFGSLVMGIYMSSYAFYRFAAADTASEAFKPKAISYVMAAGVLSAIVGPQLTKITTNFFLIPFIGSYIFIVFLNIAGIIIFFFLDTRTLSSVTKTSSIVRNRWELLRSHKILIAIMCATASYAVMNLVMTAAPLAITGCGFTQNNAADAVMLHVLAMSIPSFFTGHLIAKFGSIRIVCFGLILLMCSGIIGLSTPTLSNFHINLVLLGVGWNFGFIGSTALLSQNHSPNERGKIQGLNDFIVFGFVAVTSLASGGLLNCTGGNAASGWYLVNLSIFPILGFLIVLIVLAISIKKMTFSN